MHIRQISKGVCASGILFNVYAKGQQSGRPSIEHRYTVTSAEVCYDDGGRVTLALRDNSHYALPTDGGQAGTPTWAIFYTREGEDHRMIALPWELYGPDFTGGRAYMQDEQEPQDEAAEALQHNAALMKEMLQRR